MEGDVSGEELAMIECLPDWDRRACPTGTGGPARLGQAGLNDCMEEKVNAIRWSFVVITLFKIYCSIYRS
ncbi:MAG: hypothetical protein ACQER7_00195 [Bacteroidota bacterium]